MMTQPGHGINVGHGFVKYLIIDEDGRELPPVVFPAMIARAQRAVAGALTQVERVDAGGYSWWTGEDALHDSSPLTLLVQERLTDPAFIPALVRGALQRFGVGSLGNVATASAYGVSGLPATWSSNEELARLLGQRLRDAADYRALRIIPEPVALAYASLLDNHGELVGDRSLQRGRIGIVDLGHHTVDIAVLYNLSPVRTELNTFQLGSSQPLNQIRAHLGAAFERELTLFETDTAIRDGYLTVRGQPCDLPRGWDSPLRQNGAAIAVRLVEAWKSGADLHTILIGGGGAEIPQITDHITRRFPHAQVIADPQIAVARGYARLARRLARAA